MIEKAGIDEDLLVLGGWLDFNSFSFPIFVFIGASLLISFLFLSFLGVVLEILPFFMFIFAEVPFHLSKLFV